MSKKFELYAEWAKRTDTARAIDKASERRMNRLLTGNRWGVRRSKPIYFKGLKALKARAREQKLGVHFDAKRLERPQRGGRK